MSEELHEYVAAKAVVHVPRPEGGTRHVWRGRSVWLTAEQAGPLLEKGSLRPAGAHVDPNPMRPDRRARQRLEQSEWPREESAAAKAAAAAEEEGEPVMLTATTSELMALKLPALTRLAKRYEVPVKGKKAELVRALVEKGVVLEPSEAE